MVGRRPGVELEGFPTAALLAPENTVIFPAYLGGDMIGHYGSITLQELLIPLLVASPETESRNQAPQVDHCHLPLLGACRPPERQKGAVQPWRWTRVGFPLKFAKCVKCRRVVLK